MTYINKTLRAAMASLEQDADGWWLYYKDGWIDASSGTHQSTEDTKERTIQMANPVPCYCEDGCQAARRKMDDPETFKAALAKRGYPLNAVKDSARAERREFFF